jgi:hypothetical protein
MKNILKTLLMICLALGSKSLTAQSCQACFNWLPDSTGTLINLDATCSTPAYPAATYEWIVDGISYGGWPFPYFQIGLWNAGTHSVTLKVSATSVTGVSCVDSTTQTVSLPTVCDASFFPYAIGMTAYFYSNTAFTSGTLNWDFGDGSTGSGLNPVHTYTTAGTYNVCCTLTDTANGGCNDTKCNPIAVSTPPAPCLAVINIDSFANGVYYLNASSSQYNSNNYYMSWVLNFTLAQSGLATTFTVAPVNPIGDFVDLNIGDSLGNICGSTSIYLPGTGGGTGCFACFNVNYLNNNGDSVLLDANCSAKNTSSSLQWIVDGIILPTTATTFIQQFTTTGNHTIALNIIDSSGNICDSTFNFVYVYAPPCVSCLNINPVAGTTNQYTFDGNCGGAGMGYYTWYVDNNYVASTMTPIFNYAFAQSGTYDVCVYKTDSFGNQCLPACNTITVNTPPQTQFNICGSIYKNNANNIFWNYLPTGLNEAKVYLITLQSGGQLDAIDSTTTDANGGYCFYNKPIFDYRVKAALQPTSADYNTNLPTYYQYANMWYNANVITLANNQYGKDVLLTYGSNTSGTGFIGGNVLQGANKPVRGTDYLDGLSIILIDATTNKAIAYTKSDIGGNYSFNNLPMGKYKVYGELLNKQSIPATVDLTNTNSTVNNINLEVNKNIINPTVNAPNAISTSAKLQMDIKPNPAKGKFGIVTTSNKANVVVTDLTGKIIYTKAFDTNVVIDCANWTNGIYFVKVIAADAQKTEKLIVE